MMGPSSGGRKRILNCSLYISQRSHVTCVCKYCSAWEAGGSLKKTGCEVLDRNLPRVDRTPSCKDSREGTARTERGSNEVAGQDEATEGDVRSENAANEVDGQEITPTNIIMYYDP